MALIAVAADKGAPGVTTASVALAAVWPRPVLLAECDPAGGDLVYRLPAAEGGRLDPRRGLLSLAVAARRGLQPHQVWEHTQKLRGGLDILVGVGGAEQGSGLELLWGSVGRVLSAVPQADVIADCGRVGVDGPVYDLLAQASTVILLTRVSLGEVIRLRDRVSVLAASLQRRGRPAARIDVVVIADYKNFGAAITEVGQALRQGGVPARVVGGLAHDPKSANQLRGQWTGKLDKSMFIRTARAIAGDLASALPPPAPGARRSAPSASPALGPSGRPASDMSVRSASLPSARPASDMSVRPASLPSARPASDMSVRPASLPSGRPASDMSVRPASLPSARPASDMSVRPASDPSTRPASDTSVRPASGPFARSASDTSVRPAPDMSLRSEPGPSSDPSTDPFASLTARPTPGQAVSPTSGPGRGLDGKTTEAASVFEPAPHRQEPRPSRPSYLDGPGRLDREPPRDPTAVDQDRTRPAAAPSGRLAARGRHAGTSAAADGKDQRPPERDDAQQAQAHPSWPEPAPGTSQGRPRGA